MNWRWRSLDFILAAVFIYAGVLKTLAPLHFANDIANYHLLPWSLGVRFAFYLPWLEILCGLGLVTRQLYRGALFILLALVFVFIGASVIAKMRGIDITCGCFGTAGSSLSFSGHLVLDAVILTGLFVLSRKAIALASNEP